MENKNKHQFTKKLLLTILVLGILFFISLILGSVATLFLKDPAHTKISWKSIINNCNNTKTYIAIVCFFAIFVGIYLYFLIKLGYFNMSKLLNRDDRSSSTLHGQARWQTPSEMAKNFGQKKSRHNYTPYLWADLSKSDFEGYVCNSYKKGGKLYIEGVQKRQACVIGGTGSGKTSGFISPTIQANAISKKKSSMFIYDLKGDLYKSHSKILKDNGYNTIIINLKEPVKSVKYNPLSIIWDLYQEYLEQKKIVDSFAKDSLFEKNENKEYTTALEKITDLDGKISNYISDLALKIVPTASGENKIWSEGSQGIIKGLLWAMLEDSGSAKYRISKEKFTLSQLGNILNIPSQREELFNFLQDRPKDSMVFKKVGSILNNDSEKTVASYISNTQTNLEKFTEKAIELVTSTSDFELEDIIHHPTAIFLVIDDTMEACHILASIICSQIRNFLVLKADTLGGSLDRTWYFLLDEFANMPKLDNFGKYTSTDRSRNIFYCAIVQALSQFKKNYSEEEKNEILNNADFQLFLGSNEVESLKYIQNLFGTYTQLARSANISSQNMQSGEYNGTLSLTEKHLVNLDELQYMPRGEALLYISKLPPCKTKLVPFYDKELNDNKTFINAGIQINKINEQPNFENTFYDLEVRRRIYLGAEEDVIEEEDYVDKSGVNKAKKVIRETTEEYEAVDTSNVNQMTIDQINELLGWKTKEETKPSYDEKFVVGKNIAEENITHDNEILPTEEQLFDLDIKIKDEQKVIPTENNVNLDQFSFIKSMKAKRNSRNKRETKDNE